SNMFDILIVVGGVDIRRPSHMGITSPLNINIRGVGGTKRVMVMMDGVPLNSALTGFVQPNQIQLSSIERVEVVKGPFSSLYGSNAMGGVINIISKKRKADGVDIIPMFKSGNYDFIETGASVLGREGRFSYSLDGSYRTIDNHYRRDKQLKYSFNPSTGGFDKSYKDVSDNSKYDDTRFFARFNYDFSDVTGITFTGSYSEPDTEMGTTNYLPVERNVNTEKKLYFLNLDGHTTVLNSLNIDMRVFTNYDKSDSNCEHIIDNPAPFGPPFLFEYGHREQWGRDTGIQIKGSMPLGDFNYLTVGVDSSFMEGYWKNSKEDGTVIDHTMDESLNNQAVYLQNETELFSSIIVTVGARYDLNSKSENSFSPKLGILYKLNDRVSFRGSAGRAFRAPNLNELYTPTWMMIPGVPFESNPDLEPEIVWSYDLGTSIRITDRIDFNLTGFYSKAKNIISNPITGGVMRYENIDEVETDGFEVGLEGKILSWLTGYVNYTYTHSVDKEEGRLDNRPLHQANGGIRTVHDLGTKTSLTASLDARYNGSMFFKDRMTGKKIDLDEFTVFDFNLRLDLFDRLGIKGAVTNITNEDYEIHGSNLGPERCYWVGVDCRF
ncbi:MAG: TonB-dependent receptor, partial [Anaerolineaceae bacterium]|nr:TonB-dependent receptor [Anaerolineaceae bacterium]